jgi:DNA-3-methyladenine glycosylase II
MPDTFALKPVPPFRLDLTVWALRRRARNIIDRWDGTAYRRVLSLGDTPVEIEVRQPAGGEQPRLAVTVRGRRSGVRIRDAVREAITHMLGLKADLSSFYALAAQDQRLAPLVERFRGLKPPRFPTVFEALVNAFACQQLSLTVGIELLDRLARQCGPVMADAGTPGYGFPRPADLVRVKPPTFRKLGFSYGKAKSILTLSRSLVAGEQDLPSLERMDENEAVAQLMQLRGVGRWTAEYVLLRGLGRTNMFPGDDVGARNYLAEWLEHPQPLDYDGVKRAVARWQPYAGLVYFHFLLAGLTESGEMTKQNQQLPKIA